MSELRESMFEWIELKKQIAAARADLSVLTKREKELSEVIKKNMTQIKVENVKIQDNSVRLRVKNAKGGITKDVIQTGLNTYFSGDEVKVEGAMKAILDSAPVKERSTLSLLKSKS